jgi:hypothetical protein
LIPTGVRTPVVSMSMRALMGMVHAFVWPGSRSAWSISTTSSSRPIRSRQMRRRGSLCGRTAPLSGRQVVRSLPLGGHVPTLPLLGNAEDLPDGRRLVLRRRGEAGVVEDPPDGDLIGQEGDHLHLWPQ